MNEPFFSFTINTRLFWITRVCIYSIFAKKHTAWLRFARPQKGSLLYKAVITVFLGYSKLVFYERIRKGSLFFNIRIVYITEKDNMVNGIKVSLVYHLVKTWSQ